MRSAHGGKKSEQILFFDSGPREQDLSVFEGLSCLWKQKGSHKKCPLLQKDRKFNLIFAILSG